MRHADVAVGHAGAWLARGSGWRERGVTLARFVTLARLEPWLELALAWRMLVPKVCVWWVVTAYWLEHRIVRA